MDEQKIPVTIDQVANASAEATVKPKKRNSSYIKDSSSRVMNIAKINGLDALLAEVEPETTALERALDREQQIKAQRQKNLEQIVKLAFSACKDETAGDPDQDWLVRFFSMAQDIHNPAMQRLWAQVFKREVTNPGSTSMKALKVLRDMTPKEAQILQRAASLACSFGQDHSRKLFVGLKAHGSIFSFGKRDNTISLSLGNFQLPYSSLLVMIELGLLHAAELESGEIEQDPALIFTYQGKHLSLAPLSKGVHLLYFRFTPTGNELCKLLGNKSNMTYYDQLVAVLSQKFTVQTEVTNSVHHTV